MRSELLYHVDDRQRYPWSKRNLTVLCFGVTAGAVKGYPGKGGPHLQAPETRRCRRRFTNLENPAADSPACPVRMDEEGAILAASCWGSRRASSRPAQWSLPKSVLRLLQPPQPAMTWSLTYPGFGHKIGAVLDQLSIHPKNQLQSLLSLLRRIVARLQPQDGRADEFSSAGTSAMTACRTRRSMGCRITRTSQRLLW